MPLNSSQIGLARSSTKRTVEIIGHFLRTGRHNFLVTVVAAARCFGSGGDRQRFKEYGTTSRRRRQHRTHTAAAAAAAAGRPEVAARWRRLQTTACDVVLFSIALSLLTECHAVLTFLTPRLRWQIIVCSYVGGSGNQSCCGGGSSLDLLIRPQMGRLLIPTEAALCVRGKIWHSAVPLKNDIQFLPQRIFLCCCCCCCIGKRLSL